MRCITRGIGAKRVSTGVNEAPPTGSRSTAGGAQAASVNRMARERMAGRLPASARPVSAIGAASLDAHAKVVG